MCLIVGILRLVPQTERAVVQPVLGRVVAVPAACFAVPTVVLAVSSPPETWLPRSFPRAPCTFPAMSPPEADPPTLLLCPFDGPFVEPFVEPFEVLPPFPRRSPRLPRSQKSCAPPCVTYSVGYPNRHHGRTLCREFGWGMARCGATRKPGTPPPKWTTRPAARV